MKIYEKKLNRALLLSLGMSVLIILSFSCQKPETAIPEVKTDPETYNMNVTNLALAVSRALASSDEFRQIVKHEALKQFDGDYDILFTNIVDRKLSDYNTFLKKSASEIRIKDLLTDHLGSVSSSLKSTGATAIDDILKANPDLQISVPVHCEEWDPVSYKPVVAVVPSGFRDGITKSVPGYSPEGNRLQVDAVNEPAEAVVVISLNERLMMVAPTIHREPIPTPMPQNLSGVDTESGIRLSWGMPSETSMNNTAGYYIYRKSTSSATFEKIGTVYAYYNKAYDDNNVEPSRSYSYFVQAYYGGSTSGASNIVTLTAPANPKPVLSFDVIQQSKTQVELRWENDYSQSFNSTMIYRYRQDIDSDYKLFRTMSPSSHYCFDNDLVPGKKFIYKINHVSDLGISNPKFDFTQIPYRDISHLSPVYIHGLGFSDWSIESWLGGKPEFYVTVANVNLSTGRTYKIQEKILLQFGSRTNFQIFPDTFVFNWQPGIWYDMITFSVVEHDAGGSTTIKFSAGYNSKNSQKLNMMPVSFGIESQYEVGNGSENCGCSYLNYYEDPVQWLKFPNYGVQLLVSDKSISEMMQ